MMRSTVHPLRSAAALAAALALVLTACSSDDGDAADEASAATTTTAGDVNGFDVRAFVETLAADDFEGRDNETPGSAAAREFLIGEVSQFAEPAFPDAAGAAGYEQPYDMGTNILAVIPGGGLADEYLLVGAHYDHHGTVGGSCQGDPDDPDDEICNGATDNAAGVAAAMDIGRTLAEEGPPRRTVILAFWDGEEDNLVGATHYVSDPVAPLADTVGYINFDIQGSNLSPALTDTTVMVGAETGGPNLIDSAARATEASTLDTLALSLLFGQGRSDHAVLAAAGVPVVFYTDANNGCYHTVKDDIDAVDFAKLDQQILAGRALARDLVATDAPPEFDADAPASTYDDAVEMLKIVEVAEPDYGLFTAEEQATVQEYLTDLRAIVEAGPTAFDEEANGILLGGAVEIVMALAEAVCDGYVS